MILKALSQILAREERFMVVGSATNGCQALRHVSALAPELVLMGVHLSKLTGAEATSQIKHTKNPPVVFMVGEDGAGSRAMSEAAGADAFVPLSEDLEFNLKSRLQEWFSSNAHAFMDPEKAIGYNRRGRVTKGKWPSVRSLRLCVQ
jgi:DNA-binding NarL/FixJ family response regulator